MGQVEGSICINALVDHEVVVMPADPELVIMVCIFNCPNQLFILISCMSVPVELMPVHMLVEVLISVDRP